MSPSVVPNGELPATQWSPSAPLTPEARVRSVGGVAASTHDVDDDITAFQKLPKVGDVFLGFELIGELGRGGFGRVYLAKQRELADRPVALKVTVGPDAESQNLARLQHTNIMPIHSVHKAKRMVAVAEAISGTVSPA